MKLQNQTAEVATEIGRRLGYSIAGLIYIDLLLPIWSRMVVFAHAS